MDTWHCYSVKRARFSDAARTETDTFIPPSAAENVCTLSCDLFFTPAETKQLYDPVAYRLEPLLDKRLRDLQPEHVSPAVQ